MIRPDQMDGDLLEKAGLNPFEVWSANPRSNLAKKARRALLSFPEGREHVERLEQLSRESKSEEWAHLETLCKWAERLGCTPPSREELRAAICSTSRWSLAVESFRFAAEESALEAFPELPLPKEWIRAGKDRLRFGGLVGTWDGYDVVWTKDEEAIAEAAQAAIEAEEEARREAERPSSWPSDWDDLYQ